MTKVLNISLNIIKVFLLLICFVLTFYIVISNYRRLDKNLFDSIHNFIPFFLLFIMFSINFILKQKCVRECSFYNITCVLVLIMVLFVIYRTLFDKNMILYLKLGYNINFDYFMDMILPIRLLLYGLSLTNILLIINDKYFLKIK